MSFRRLITVGVLAASAAVLPALPGQAAPSTGNCGNPDYPTNATSLSLAVTPTRLTAGQSATAFGELRKNACPVRGAKIRIERKRLVNGTQTGKWALVATATTRPNGLYSATFAPLHNELVRAHFTGASDFPRAWSQNVTVKVRTKITEAAKSGSACTITLTGTTTPAKSRHTVTIQNRGAKGHFNGWKFFARGTTNRTGHYSITKTATCGKTYNLSALIASDSTNLGGRSATVYGVKAAS
jgi:hypothetical protein